VGLLADFDDLLPAFFSLHNADAVLSNLKVIRKEFYQGLIDFPFHRGSGQSRAILFFTRA
jgi:hypothetical protein